MVTEGSNKKWVKDVKEELQDNYVGYFGESSVHGLKYLTERRRPWPEKVLWFIGVSVGLVACIWLMYKTTMRWVENPVIVAMDDSHRTVWQIPFPAVTVCPQAKTKFFNYTDYATRYKKKNLTKEEEVLLARAQILCKIPVIVNDNISVIDKNGTDTIEKYSLGIMDVITTTNMKPFNDPEFQPILTKEGVCFSFNMMPNKAMFREGTFHYKGYYLRYFKAQVTWDPTEGYEKDIDLLQAYPRPSLGVGEETGLYIALKTQLRYLHSMCNTLGHGFQVILHSPIEFPQLRHETVFIPLDSFTEVFLTPQEIRTSQDLRDRYTPTQRQCYFHDERYLKYFKFYTQKNCELECLANTTLRECGCVEFYMPRMPETPVCGKDELCVKRIAGQLYLNSKDGKYCKECSGRQNIRHPPCECLQSCAHIRYVSHHVQSAPDPVTAEQLLHGKDTQTKELTNHSQVLIYYKDSLFIPIRRLEVFGAADLMASLGGLMGLCMGVSLLSVIELFYWLLIRPFCQRIKQSNPQLRSVKKHDRCRNVEAAVQYSRYLENDENKQTAN